MKTDAVVLSFNGNEDTMECLRSLGRAGFAGSRIHVVDNGSSPPLRPDLEAAGLRVDLVESPENLGFTGGSNLGIRRALESGAEAILLLNNDTVVDPDFLGPLVKALSEDPGLGIVSPKIYFHGQDRVIWAHGARVDRFSGRSPHIGVYEKDSGQYERVREVDRVTGCAMLVRRDFVERVGFLDNRFFAYSEEMDWCLRARRAGYRLAVVKESVIWHKGHRASGRIGRPFIAYLQARNHLLMLRKHSDFFFAGGSLALIYFAVSLFWHVAESLSVWILKGDRRHRDQGMAMALGVVDYWRGRWGKPARGLA